MYSVSRRHGPPVSSPSSVTHETSVKGDRHWERVYATMQSSARKRADEDRLEEEYDAECDAAARRARDAERELVSLHSERDRLAARLQELANYDDGRAEERWEAVEEAVHVAEEAAAAARAAAGRSDRAVAAIGAEVERRAEVAALEATRREEEAAAEGACARKAAALEAAKVRAVRARAADRALGAAGAAARAAAESGAEAATAAAAARVAAADDHLAAAVDTCAFEAAAASAAARRAAQAAGAHFELWARRSVERATAAAEAAEEASSRAARREHAFCLEVLAAAEEEAAEAGRVRKRIILEEEEARRASARQVAEEAAALDREAWLLEEEAEVRRAEAEAAAWDRAAREAEAAARRAAAAEREALLLEEAAREAEGRGAMVKEEEGARRLVAEEAAKKARGPSLRAAARARRGSLSMDSFLAALNDKNIEEETTAPETVRGAVFAVERKAAAAAAAKAAAELKPRPMTECGRCFTRAPLSRRVVASVERRGGSDPSAPPPPFTVVEFAECPHCGDVEQESAVAGFTPCPVCGMTAPLMRRRASASTLSLASGDATMMMMADHFVDCAVCGPTDAPGPVAASSSRSSFASGSSHPYLPATTATVVSPSSRGSFDPLTGLKVGPMACPRCDQFGATRMRRPPVMSTGLHDATGSSWDEYCDCPGCGPNVVGEDDSSVFSFFSSYSVASHAGHQHPHHHHHTCPQCAGPAGIVLPATAGTVATLDCPSCGRVECQADGLGDGLGDGRAGGLADGFAGNGHADGLADGRARRPAEGNGDDVVEGEADEQNGFGACPDCSTTAPLMVRRAGSESMEYCACPECGPRELAHGHAYCLAAADEQKGFVACPDCSTMAPLLVRRAGEGAALSVESCACPKCGPRDLAAATGAAVREGSVRCPWCSTTVALMRRPASGGVRACDYADCPSCGQVRCVPEQKGFVACGECGEAAPLMRRLGDTSKAGLSWEFCDCARCGPHDRREATAPAERHGTVRCPGCGAPGRVPHLRRPASGSTPASDYADCAACGQVACGASGFTPTPTGTDGEGHPRGAERSSSSEVVAHESIVGAAALGPWCSQRGVVKCPECRTRSPLMRRAAFGGRPASEFVDCARCGPVDWGLDDRKPTRMIHAGKLNVRRGGARYGTRNWVSCSVELLTHVHLDLVGDDVGPVLRYLSDVKEAHNIVLDGHEIREKKTNDETCAAWDLWSPTANREFCADSAEAMRVWLAAIRAALDEHRQDLAELSKTRRDRRIRSIQRAQHDAEGDDDARALPTTFFL